MEILSLNNVSKRFGKGLIIRDISFSLKKGEFVSIVGPYGCGKSTLIKLISGIYSDYEGQILINNFTPREAIRSRKVGYCSQMLSLLPWRNVLENLLLPQEIAGIKDTPKIHKLLKLVNSENLAHKMVSQLSGGMKQIVSVVRSLVLEPDLLILDEPFSSIDEINRQKLQEILLKIHTRTAKSTILVTHSTEEAVFLSDRVLVMSKTPGTIKKIVRIKLQNRDRKTKYSTKFIIYVRRIRKVLNE